MEANPPQPKVVKVIKAVDALYFDGYCQQSIGEKSVGQVGKVTAWHYDDDNQVTHIDVWFDHENDDSWNAIESPIENFVALDQECPECNGQGWLGEDELECQHCQGWGLVEKG